MGAVGLHAGQDVLVGLDGEGREGVSEAFADDFDGDAMPTIAHPEPGHVVGGVDTHKHTHVAAALDHIGRVLAVKAFPATGAGDGDLLAWLRQHGELVAVGVEGCGSWGAGLARHCSAAGVRVIEANRPNRQNRRRRGKSDPLAAEPAARAVLAGDATVTPRPATALSRPSGSYESPEQER